MNVYNKRFKVIANYPNSNFKTGQEIVVEEDIMSNGVDKYSYFPHIFLLINWWKDVDIKEMPKFLKYESSNSISYHKVKKWNLEDKKNITWINESNQVKSLWCDCGKKYMPCSEEEYLSNCNNIQFGLVENEELQVMTSNQRHQLLLFDKIEKELSRKPFSNEELEFILKAVKNSHAFVIVFDKA